MKDKSKIPWGRYCYCKNGCPYRREVSGMKVDFGMYVSQSVVVCDYLDVNTMGLMLEYPWTSWLLEDSCKICDENMNEDCEASLTIDEESDNWEQWYREE